MNKQKIYALKAAKKIYTKFIGSDSLAGLTNEFVQYSNNDANNQIKQKLE